MIRGKIAQARHIVARCLEDTAVVWRCTGYTTDETGARSRNWEYVGDVKCIVQQAGSIEPVGQSAQVRDEFSMVFKTLVGADTEDGDCIELVSGDLSGERFILGAPQEQSLAILRFHGCDPYRQGEKDSWSV